MGIVAGLLRSIGQGAHGDPGPTTPLLSITDNGDDTGATATITLSDATATNMVFTKKVDGEFSTSGWTSSGSVVGNGTIALGTLAAGYYWGYAESVGVDLGETTTDPIFFEVTSGLDSVLYRCLTAAKAKIQLLSLTGLATSSVLVRKFPVDEGFGPGGVALPAIVLAPTRESPRIGKGTNNLDDVGYGVGITILDVDNRTLVANLDTYTLWREKISKAFRNQRLPGVSEVYTCTIETSDLFSAPAWRNNKLASLLTLRFESREGRGI